MHHQRAKENLHSSARLRQCVHGAAAEISNLGATWPIEIWDGGGEASAYPK